MSKAFDPMAAHGNGPSSREQGAIRAIGSKMFAEAIKELVILGYGVVKVEKPLTYRSLKDITRYSILILRSAAGDFA